MRITHINLYVSTILLLGVIFVPYSAYAVGSIGSGGQYFGGMQTLVYNSGMCSCSGTNVHVIKDEAGHGMLMLYYNGSGKIYGNNNISNVGGWQLGSYTTQTTQCTQIAYPKCLIIATATGVYSSEPGTGTSMMNTAKKIFASAFTKVIKNFTVHNDNA